MVEKFFNLEIKTQNESIFIDRLIFVHTLLSSFPFPFPFSLRF